MTELLERAVETLRHLPATRLDEMARLLMDLAGSDRFGDLSAEERADLEAADAEVDRGELATDEEVRAMWAKHGV